MNSNPESVKTQENITSTAQDQSGRVFSTDIPSSSAPMQELGHQKVDPRWSELARTCCLGFLSGTASRVARTESRALVFSLPLVAALECFVSDFSEELRYDHEYAREVWEHEYNGMGEIDEYVAYATAKGISPAKARDIALSVTSEPDVSVPYHLAFELGLIQPLFYKRKLEHAIIAGIGFMGGVLGSDLAFSLGSKLLSSRNPPGKAMMAVVPASLALLSPLLLFRFSHVQKVRGSRTFKIITFAAYAATVSLLVYLNRTR